MKSNPGSMPSDLKYNNRIRVLDALRALKISTAGVIAENTGLSRQTVTKSLTSFIEKGIVVCVGKGGTTATGGKPPEQYAITNEKFFICISLWPNDLRITLFSLDGNVICGFSEDHPLGINPKEEIDYAADKCLSMLKNNGIEKSAVCAVSLSTSGIIDRKNGLLKYSSQSPEWGSDIPMEKYLSSHFENAIIFLENAGKMTARPYLNNEKLSDKRILVIFASWGLSSCLIEKNNILNGKNSLIGEIGHMVIEPGDKEKCGCGGYGCLERLVSPRRLNAIIKEKAKDYPLSPLAKKTATLHEIFALSGEGDILAKELSRYTAEAFSLALRNISLVFDPDMVVFQGDYSKADDTFNKTLLTTLKQFRYYPHSTDAFEIVYDDRPLKELDTLGSYIAVADSFFSNSDIYE